MIVVTELKKKQSENCYVQSFPCTSTVSHEGFNRGGNDANAY